MNVKNQFIRLRNRIISNDVHQTSKIRNPTEYIVVILLFSTENTLVILIKVTDNEGYLIRRLMIPKFSR